MTASAVWLIAKRPEFIYVLCIIYQKRLNIQKLYQSANDLILCKQTLNS